MTSLFYRQDNTCTAPYAFYRCSKGPFVGCCSVDPCTTGVCPDQNQDTSGLASEAASTTSGPEEPSVSVSVLTVGGATTTSVTASIVPNTVTAVPVPEPTSSSTSKQDTPSSSSSSVSSTLQRTTISLLRTTTKEKTTPTSLSTFLLIPQSTQNVSSPNPLISTNPSGTLSASNTNAARTGGIAAGIASLFIITVLLMGCICYRRRKKEGKKFVLLKMKWEDERTHHDTEKAASSRKDPSEEFGSRPYPNISRMKDSNPPDTASTTSTLPEYKRSMTQLTCELPGFIPRRADITPELTDDISPRLRAELSSHPERHLINIPAGQRQNGRIYPTSPTTGMVLSTQPPRLPSLIATTDGVILSANLSGGSGKDGGTGNYSHENEDSGLVPEYGHVLSFMDYSSASNGSSTVLSSIQRQGALHGNTGIQTSNSTTAKIPPKRTGQLSSYANQQKPHKVTNVRIPPGSTSSYNGGGTELPG